MKVCLKILVFGFLLQNLASCAYFGNKKTVELRVESSPANADIIIEGRNYGKTPATIMLEPKNQDLILHKEGYGSARVKLETWQAVRRDKAEGSRCLADAVGSMLILPALSYWSVYCRDFKQPKYLITIPYSGPTASVPPRNNNGQNRNYNAIGGGEYYDNYYGNNY